MSHKTLVEQAMQFLDVATYQQNPKAPVQIEESEEVVTSRISEASRHLSKMFGNKMIPFHSEKINEEVNKHLVKFNQANLYEETDISVHDFSNMSHGDAYNRTQTDSSIKNGDVLKVKNGTAVMVDAWPIMVHGKSDAFHSFRQGVTLEKFSGGKYAASAQKAHDVHNGINESVETTDIKVGDTVQTIKQGQQIGKVEKIAKSGGILKVYHRHENGNLYASAPSNLKVINEAIDNGPGKIQAPKVSYGQSKNSTGYVKSKDELKNIHNTNKATSVQLAKSAQYHFDRLSKMVEKRKSDEHKKVTINDYHRAFEGIPDIDPSDEIEKIASRRGISFDAAMKGLHTHAKKYGYKDFHDAHDDTMKLFNQNVNEMNEGWGAEAAGLKHLQQQQDWEKLKSKYSNDEQMSKHLDSLQQNNWKPEAAEQVAKKRTLINESDDLQESINIILQELLIESLDQLSEEMQDEVLSIAKELSPHL